MQFVKYQGTGNDFIIIDNRKQQVQLSPEAIQRLCHRRLGIGADGLMLLEPSLTEDFEMSYYNSDGSSGMMCGNGGRCIAAFAYRTGIVGERCSFRAPDGLHQAAIVSSNENITEVKMSMRDCGEVLRLSDKEFFVHTGAPHLVIFTENVEEVGVYDTGLERSYDKRLPERSNVNFVEIKAGYLCIRTFERGVEDETLSCGTGITASALAFDCLRPSEKRGVKTKVAARGGLLSVYYSRKEDGYEDIWLEGPTEYVFEGAI